MEIRHRILEFSGSALFGILKAELDKIGAPYRVKVLGVIGGVEKRSIELTVGESDPLYPHIAQLIEKHGFYVQTGVYFTDQDIKEAEWLYASVGEFQYPQPEDRYMEATYDTSAYCPWCGMGAVQNRAFRLKSDFKQKSLQFLGLHWVFDQVFVRPEAKHILEQAGVGDIGFLFPVYHKAGLPIETVHQIVVRAIAAPGLVTEGLQPVTCRENNEEGSMPRRSGEAHGIGRRFADYAFCGRVKYHHPQTTMLTFTRSSLSGLPDVAMSNEYFGSGAGAHRLILVRQRIVALVRRYKLRGLEFTPVRIV